MTRLFFLGNGVDRTFRISTLGQFEGNTFLAQVRQNDLEGFVVHPDIGIPPHGDWVEVSFNFVPKQDAYVLVLHGD